MLRFILVLLLFPVTSFGQSVSVSWGKEIEITDADRNKIEAIYDIDIPTDSGSLYLEFKAGDQKVRNFSAYLNGKRLHADLSAGKMTPIKVSSSSNQLKVYFRGHTGTKVSVRLTDLENYEALVGPVLIDGSKAKIDYQKTFSVDTTGEYLIVAESKSTHSPESLRHVYLNGQRVFKDDCFVDFLFGFQRRGGQTVRAIHLSGENDLKVKLSKGDDLVLSVLKNPSKHISPAALSIENLVENVPSPVTPSTVIRVQGESLSSDPESTVVIANNEVVDPSRVHVAGNSITVDNLLKKGFNIISVASEDSSGRSISYEAEFWAGNRTLRVRTIDPSGNPVLSGSVELKPFSLPPFKIKANIVNGIATFRNVPDGPLMIIGIGSDGAFGSFPATVYESTELSLTIGTTNSIDLFASNAPSSKKSSVQSAAQTLAAPIQVQLGKIPLGFVAQADKQFPTRVWNLDFTTYRETTINYSNFKTSIPVPAGARTVTIKVKIDGTAVPNIDTEYPLIGRAVVYAYIPDSDGSFATYSLGSGWGLDSGEAYYFLNIPPGAEEIVVYGALNYYGYESPVTVSLLELNYTGMELQRFRLLDLTGPPLRDGVDPAQNLQLVSIDGAFINSYLNNKSVFGADIRVLLSPGDKLTNAELQITGPTGTVATANLTAAGKSILARQSQQYVYLGSLGPQSEVNIFEMSPSEASKIKPATEKNHVKISLILRTEFGQELTVPYEDINDASLFPLLVYYQPKNRYGNNEDLQWGGDRWARPGVVERMTDISNTWNTANPSKKLTINDFSNMHGGPFPIHGAHKSGRSVDCRFDSFPLVIDGAGPYPGKAAAEDLAKFLNSLSDRDIERLVAIYVSWVKNSEFITTLKANLKDDKRRKLMTNVTGHKDHFHLEFRAKKGDSPVKE